MTNTRLSYVIVRDIDKSSGEVRAGYMHWAEFISPTWNRTDKCLNGDTDPSTDPLPPNKTYRHFFAKFSIDTKQGKHYPTNVLVADLNYPLEQLRCFLDLTTAIYCMHVDVSVPKKKIILHVVTVPLKKELQVKETVLDLVGSDRSSFFPPKDTQFDINWRVNYVHGFERTAQNYYASVYNKNTLVFFQLTIDPVTHQASLETEGKLELKTFRLRECESLGSNFNEKYIPYRIISLKRTLLVLYPGVRTDSLAVPGRTSLLASLFARSPFTVSHTQVISDNYSTSVLVAGVSEMNVHVALSAIYFTTRNMMDYSYCIIMLEIKRDSLSWNKFEVRFQEDGQFLPMTPSYRVRSSSKVGYDYQLMVSDGAKQCVAKLCIIQRTIFDNWCGPIRKDSKLDDPDREFIPVESGDENNTLLSISPDPRLFETFNLTRVNATKNADYIVIVPGTNTKLNVFKATSEGSKYTYILGQLVSDHGYIDILVSLAYQPKLLINIDYLGELTKNRAHNFSSLILDYNENMLYMTSRIETEETVHMIWRLWQYDIQQRMLLPDEKLLNSNETIFDALYYRDSSQIYLSGQKIVIKNIEDNIEDSIPAPFPVEMGIRGVVLSDYFQGIGIYYASQVLTVISFGDLTTLATITLEYEPRFILTNRMDRAYVGYYDGSKTIISMIKSGEFHSKLIYVTEIAEDVISATLVNPLTAGRFDGFALLTKHKLIYMNKECKFHKEYPLRFEKGYLLSLNNTVVVINTDLTESDDTPKSYIMNRIIPPSGPSSRGDMKTIAIVVSCVCGAILIAITIISSLTAGGLLVNRLQRRKALNELNEHLLQEDFSSVFSVNSSVTTVGDDTIQIKNSIACLIPMQQLQIMKKISEGAYGVVYYGKWKGVEVAIKRLKVDDKKGFAREVSVLNALRHPSVVLFCGLSIDDAENLYIITEFVPGGTLDEAIYSKRSKSKDKRKFSFADKVRMLLEICNAMVYLHDCNIMHRDLKPANILLDASNNIKLCDFGVSKVESSQTMTGVNYGTLEYMAVEIIQDNTHYSQKCDVYSFGIMMHELFFMEKPYSSFQLDESSSSGSSSGSLSNNNNSIFSLGFKVLEGTRPFIPEVLISSKDAIDNMSDSELDDMLEWFERSNYTPKSLNLQDQSKKRQYCKAMVLFIHLCRQCWNKKPDIRPSFEEIIPLLIQVRDAIPSQ